MYTSLLTFLPGSICSYLSSSVAVQTEYCVAICIVLHLKDLALDIRIHSVLNFSFFFHFKHIYPRIQFS